MLGPDKLLKVVIGPMQRMLQAPCFLIDFWSFSERYLNNNITQICIYICIAFVKWYYHNEHHFVTLYIMIYWMQLLWRGYYIHPANCYLIGVWSAGDTILMSISIYPFPMQLYKHISDVSDEECDILNNFGMRMGGKTLSEK